MGLEGVLDLRSQALALHRVEVQQDRPAHGLGVVQEGDQLAQVVAVHRAEIAEAQRLEEDRLVAAHVFLEGALHVLQPAQNLRAEGHVAGDPLHLVPQGVVGVRGRDAGDGAAHPAGEGPHVVVDAHAVVVEDHQQVQVQRSGHVERLVGQPSRHRAIAHHCDHVVILPAQVPRHRHAQRRGDGRGSVSRAHVVVRAFPALQELAQPAPLTIIPEPPGAPGEQFVHMGLMTHIPGDAVFEKVELVEQGHGQLHHAQRRPQVAAGGMDGLDQESPRLLAERGQAVAGKRLHRRRVVQGGKQGIFVRSRIHKVSRPKFQTVRNNKIRL